MNVDRWLLYGATLVTVVALIAAAVILLTKGESETSGAAPVEHAATGDDASPRFTAVSVLVGGLDKTKIDTRVFTIINSGVEWSELGSKVFPGSEVQPVMIYQEDRGLSVGLGAEPRDPARVEALWREMGQPGRGRTIYFLPIGEPRSKQLEAWMREQLTGLGFKLTSDRSKAREGVMLTLVR
jgi:hypothetical protein